MSAPYAHTPLALALALAAAGLTPAHAQEVKSLNPITVSGDAQATPLNPGVKAERARLDGVAGGTNLIEPQKETRLVTLKDALDYQPGLVVQEFFGGLDQPRLNIRGSGIQSNPVNRGVMLLQDGLPLNEADGSFVIGFLEPRNARLISARRGANALSPAATTLGGELDFQSLTGTEGDVLRVEGGSFGRFGAQAAKGLRSDNLDGRLSVTHDKYDGYRHYSGSERTSVQGNFGIQGDGFENRTYLSYTDLDVDIPFVVTREQMEHDPRQTNGEGVKVNPPFNQIDIGKRQPHRTSRQFRAANRTYWGTEALNNTVGVYAQNIDDVFQDPLTATATKGMTYGAQWQLAGKFRTIDYRVALDWSRSDMDRDLYTVNKETGSRKTHYGNYDLQAENRNALLGFAWHVAPQWTVVGDAKFTQAIRDARDRFTGKSLDQDWNYVSPKLGLVWQPVESQRFFVNVSRSNEAPTYWEIIGGGSLPNPLNDAVGTSGLSELKLQRADTVEIGGEGLLGAGAYAPHWALTLYHSDVKDELMSVSTANGTAAGTYNYRGGTRHQGIELGLNGSLPAFGEGAAFDYRVAYTFSDFRFKGGEYAGNRIAGVPRHLVSAEVLYRVGGLRFGPNVRWMPAATETNHANTPDTQQDSYALLGFKVDYQIDKHWQAYVQGDNLTDETYASAFVIRNTGTTAMPTFLPGNGRSVTAGVNYRF
ncbi:TonB-dependent receptor family protein [Castellaniella defragrans]|uniref:Iron complex outermembrane receptor protein n=1 Tax=Castellaniella defragrans TaxID=75697 RepID=A0A7W9WLR4_CASDE|nr:TonB-dependent receptor [Castellaniella defragrans]KAB0615375.1 TonB-dependent receptor [Castellaniella defragrans]MBB6083512.1 iron complex outermembrane receptor protein [Castellaniella defragrans]